MGVLKNPIKSIIMDLRPEEYNDFYREQICFHKTEYMKYYRIIELFCHSREEQRKLAEESAAADSELKRNKLISRTEEVKRMKKVGVNGIGRIFVYSYNMRYQNILSYSLWEGELNRG